MARDRTASGRRLHQARARRARVHADLPRVSRRVRRRGPRGDRGDGAPRRHVHAGVLPGASPGDRRDLLSARRRSDSGVLHPHAQRAIHRGGGGRRHRRQRAAGGLRTDRGRILPRARERPEGRYRRSPGSQRLHRRDRHRQTAGVPSEHGRAARLHRGRRRTRAHSPGGGRESGSRRTRGHAHHRLRDPGGHHRGRGGAGHHVLRNRVPDHRPVRLPLHPVDPSDHTAPRLLPGRSRLAARRAFRARLRSRSDVDPGAVPGVRDRGQPRGTDGELGPRGGGRRRERPGRRARERAPSSPSGRGGARLRFGRVHHHLPHRGTGHQGNRDDRQPRGRRHHPHQPGPAAGTSVVFRGG